MHFGKQVDLLVVVIEILPKMISSFKDKQTRKVWMGVWEEHIPNEIQEEGFKKLEVLDHIRSINDLEEPTSNHLEKLDGDLMGYYSIRINEKWRIIFEWDGKNVSKVQILNYHH